MEVEGERDGFVEESSKPKSRQMMAGNAMEKKARDWSTETLQRMASAAEIAEAMDCGEEDKRTEEARS